MKRTIRKKRLGLLLGAMVAAAAALFGWYKLQTRWQAGSLLAQATELSESNPQQAISFYQRYINFQPRDAEAFRDYVDLKERIAETHPREKHGLIDLYERLLQLDDSQIEKRRKLIDLLLFFGQGLNPKEFQTFRYFTDGRVHLNFLMNYDKGRFRDEAWLWEQLALVELGENRTRNVPAAIEHLRTALNCKTVPAKPQSHLLLAQLIRKETKSPTANAEARQILDDLVRNQPEDPEARLARAEFLLDLNQAKKAREDIEFVRKSPARSKPHVLLALARFDVEDKRYKDARDLLMDGIKKNQGDIIIFRLRLAEVLINLGERQQALDQLKASLSTIKLDDRYALAFLDWIMNLGDFDSAAAPIKTYEANPETKPFAEYLKARIDLQKGDWAGALNRLQSCVLAIEREAGMEGRALLMMALCHQAGQNPEGQLEAASRAVLANIRLVDAHRLKANAYERLGQWNQAVSIYRVIRDKYEDGPTDTIRALLNDEITKDARSRSWTELDALLPSAQTDPVREELRIRMLSARLRTEEAVRAAEEAAAKHPKDVPLQVINARLQAVRQNPTAGLLVLDRAEKNLGDRADLRLARASIRVLDPALADPKAILALGDNADAMSPEDRYRLWMGLADQLRVMNRPVECAILLRKAADLQPHDVSSRLGLLDIAFAARDAAKAAGIVKEFERIEGPQGITTLVTSAAVELLTLDKSETKRLAELRRNVEAAKQKRDGWARTYTVLGDLYALMNNDDGAIEHYVMAIDRGDRNPALFRKTYQMLVNRRQFERANQLLAKAGRTQTISTEAAKWGAAWNLGTTDPKAALALIDPNSRNPSDQLLRAQLLVLTNQNTDAEIAFRNALTFSGGKAPDVWVALVRFLASTQKLDAAKNAIAEAEKTLTAAAIDNKSLIPFTLGMCHEAIGNLPEAEKQYKLALKTPGDSLFVVSQLANLYQRTGKRAEAEELLTQALATSPPDSTRRQFRRSLAVCKVSHDYGYEHIAEASALIEQNIREANQIEDLRTKALILAVDPFRRTEARNLLIETARTYPLSADEQFLLARLHLDERNFPDAESALIAATKTPHVQPLHLAWLARVQIQMDKVVSARETIDRLSLLIPSSWEASAERARLAAKSGDAALAARIVLNHPFASNLNFVELTVAPYLEELGCRTEAEKQFQRIVNESKAPSRHKPLALFYLRQHQPVNAIELTRRFADSPGVTSGMTARLYSAAVRSRPIGQSDPDGSWAKTVAEIKTWLAAKLTASPNDANLNYASAEIADAEGRYTDAIAAYEKTLTLEPANRAAANNLAFLLALHAGDTSDRPLKLMDAAMKRQGPTPASLDTRGMIHLMAGRVNEAIADLTQAARLKPEPIFHYHLAVAYDKAGQNQKRDQSMRLAKAEGLTKVDLHPTEWATYEKMIAPPPKPEDTGESKSR